MRLLAKVTIPQETRDEAHESGALRSMQVAMQRLRPESAYFVEEDGKFECLFVFDLDLASLLQPLFPGLDASFHVAPVMNAAEFQRTLGEPPAKQPVVAPDLVTDLSSKAKASPEQDTPPDGDRPTGAPWVSTDASVKRDDE